MQARTSILYPENISYRDESRFNSISSADLGCHCEDNVQPRGNLFPRAVRAFPPYYDNSTTTSEFFIHPISFIIRIDSDA